MTNSLPAGAGGTTDHATNRGYGVTHRCAASFYEVQVGAGRLVWRIVMSNTSVVVSALDASRRRPNPGYRVAPPVHDAYTPWVSALEDELGSGEYRWIPDADGALVPTPITDEDETQVRAKRRLWGRRTQ
jgi:hypothetical protein